jgi:hypothetical protein
MQLTAYEIALIAGGFGISGALLSALVSYRFALKIASTNFNNSLALFKISSHKEAASNLQSAFAPKLDEIKFSQAQSTGEIQKILEVGIDSLTTDMAKFRFHVSPENLSVYDAACKEYKDVARIRNKNYELGDKTACQMFEEKIHAVLRFTNL